MPIYRVFAHIGARMVIEAESVTHAYERALDDVGTPEIWDTTEEVQLGDADESIVEIEESSLSDFEKHRIDLARPN